MTAIPVAERHFLRIPEAAQMLGISRDTLLPYLDCAGVRGGSYHERHVDPKITARIKTAKVGGQRLIVRQSLDDFARELLGKAS